MRIYFRDLRFLHPVPLIPPMGAAAGGQPKITSGGHLHTKIWRDEGEVSYVVECDEGSWEFPLGNVVIAHIDRRVPMAEDEEPPIERPAVAGKRK